MAFTSRKSFTAVQAVTPSALENTLVAVAFVLETSVGFEALPMPSRPLENTEFLKIGE